MKPQLLNYIEVLVSNQCSGASMCRRILKDTTCPLIKITAKCVMIADTILAQGRGTNRRAAPGSRLQLGTTASVGSGLSPNCCEIPRN